MINLLVLRVLLYWKLRALEQRNMSKREKSKKRTNKSLLDMCDEKLPKYILSPPENT